MRRFLAGVVLASGLVVSARGAWAQDFGTDWIDRVTLDRQIERGPLPAVPLQYDLSGGIAWFADDNIYLTEKDEKDDQITVPFARLKLKYAETNLDVKLDTLLSYNDYTEEDDESGTEWRTYAKIRYVGSRLRLELVEILRLETDPLDVLLVERAERWVSNTLPRISYDIAKSPFTVEAFANIQDVDFTDSAIGDSRDNTNVRAGGAFVYHTPWGYDLIAEGGGINIRYSEPFPLAPPDVEGYFVRAGYRGELTTDLHADVFAGYTAVESDSFDTGTGISFEGKDDDSMDVSSNLYWDASEQWQFNLGYDRLFTFSGGFDPYQITNRFKLLVDWQAVEEFSLRGRAQYDVADTANGVDRTYSSFGFGATYNLGRHLSFDAGVTARSGEVDDGVNPSVEFDNVIYHIGGAYTY